jgi:hypothetical protein
MDVILKLKLIPYESISETAESMLSSIELNGPALLADSSSSLWTTLIRLRTAENPSFFGQTSDRVLHWFFSKWSPSESFNSESISSSCSLVMQVFSRKDHILLRILSIAMPRTSCD